MQQLMAWDHVTGTFSPKPRRTLPEKERPPTELSHFKLTAEWSGWWRKAPRESASDRSRAVQKLTSLIRRLNDGGEATAGLPHPSELVVTLDLDNTLWDGECVEWPVGSFEAYAVGEGAWGEGSWRRQMQSREQDEDGRYDMLELHGEVPLVFAALRNAEVTIAIASASSAKDSALALLEGFELYDDALLMEMGDDDKRKKVGHIERLARRLEVPAAEVRRRFVLFDDSEANVDEVRERLKCNALVVDQVAGIRVRILLTMP